MIETTLDRCVVCGATGPRIIDVRVVDELRTKITLTYEGFYAQFSGEEKNELSALHALPSFIKMSNLTPVKDRIGLPAGALVYDQPVCNTHNPMSWANICKELPGFEKSMKKAFNVGTEIAEMTGVSQGEAMETVYEGIRGDETL